MESRLEEFSRYLFCPQNSITSGFGGFSDGFRFSYFGGSHSDRNEVSSIINKRVYLSNLPHQTPFSGFNLDINNKKDKAALVVSCGDINELANSELLLEPNGDQIQYHVLAMEDCIAKVGCEDQVYDTLALMSEFADEEKPIFIHCISGVGRSAMMAALHLAHRYLLKKDSIVNDCIDDMLKKQDKTLNPESNDFIKNLYRAVSAYVLANRRCCQFDHPGRNNFAVSILTEINKKIQQGQSIIGHRDENYYFLADFVQSREFKKLQYHYYRSPIKEENKSLINRLMKNFVTNSDNWYKHLVNTAYVELYGKNKENLNPEANNQQEFDWRDLLGQTINAINRISDKWLESIYSQNAAMYRAKVEKVTDRQALQQIERDNIEALNRINISRTYMR